MPNLKRQLTEEEIIKIQHIMENAPQGKKPSIRTLAKVFNVTRPSLMKSLKGWKKIQRKREQVKKPLFPATIIEAQAIKEPRRPEHLNRGIDEER